MNCYQYNFENLGPGDVLLISPHPTPPVAPLSGIAFVAGKLRSFNVSVSLLDLGLDSRKWFTEPDRLHKMAPLYKGSFVPIYTRAGIHMADVPVTEIAPNIGRVFNFFKHPFIDKDAYKKACAFYYSAFFLYDSLGKGRISPPGSYFSPWKNMEFSEVLNQLLENEDIHAEFVEASVKAILKNRYKVIGFSLLHGDQWFTALGVAKSLKNNGYAGKIVFGGVQVSLFFNHIKETPDFFKFVDWYSPKRCDVFCEDLSKFLKGSFPESKVRNIAHLDPHNKILYTSGYDEPSIETTCPPYYNDLLLDDYLVPEVTLPIQSMTKCYWCQCKFCMLTGDSLVNRNTALPSEQVMEHMVVLYEKYRCKHFFFSDDSTHPHTLSEVARLIIKNKFPFTWRVQGFIPEKDITFDVLKEWHEGGCRSLSTGFETASKRLLSILGKKHQTEDLERVLVDCKKLKILTYCFGFFGHPLETEEDIIETLVFKRKYENIATYFLTYVWSLTPCNIEFKNYDKLGIEIIKEDAFRTYGKQFANVRWNSPSKELMKEKLDRLLKEYGATEKPRNYYWSDWMQFGHSLHLPYEWMDS